jgi:two-component system response regulator AtoC
MIRRMVVLVDGERDFEAQVTRLRPGRGPAAPARQSVSESLRDIARRGAREAERHALAEVLERVRWNRAEASRILKVSYKTLLNKIAECELTAPARRLS